jgi:hypothetical protein
MSMCMHQQWPRKGAPQCHRGLAKQLQPLLAREPNITQASRPDCSAVLAAAALPAISQSAGCRYTTPHVHSSCIHMAVRPAGSITEGGSTPLAGAPHPAGSMHATWQPCNHAHRRLWPAAQCRDLWRVLSVLRAEGAVLLTTPVTPLPAPQLQGTGSCQLTTAECRPAGMEGRAGTPAGAWPRPASTQSPPAAAEQTAELHRAPPLPTPVPHPLQNSRPLTPTHPRITTGTCTQQAGWSHRPTPTQGRSPLCTQQGGKGHDTPGPCRLSSAESSNTPSTHSFRTLLSQPTHQAHTASGPC